MAITVHPVSALRPCWALLLAPLLATGCALTESSLCNSDKPPSPGNPCQIVATWQKNIAYAADPTHNGQLNPGLAGRLYLFGQKIDYPMTGNGALTVEMFDDTHEQPVKVEQWSIDPVTLQKLLRCDMIGWGYTLFLPSGTWKPEMSKIRVRTCYQPNAGAPLYAENAVVLAETNGIIREEIKHTPLPPPVPVR
jgi:hypothetical protein